MRNTKYKKNTDPYEQERVGRPFGKSRGKMPPPSRAINERVGRKKRLSKQDILRSWDGEIQ